MHDHHHADLAHLRAVSRVAAWERLAARHLPSCRPAPPYPRPDAADLARLTADGRWHTLVVEASVNDWDLVLRGGRVIDPESALDAVRDVAVADGRIAAVGSGLPPGPARGLRSTWPGRW